jgi:predicted nucleic acid-binding protein
VKAFLPDVNALLALLDPMHLHHEAAHNWYAAQGPIRLVLCSHVLNGVMRVASQPRYPNPLGTCAQVRNTLKRFVEKVGPSFCETDVSLLNDAVLVRAGELTPSRVGDLYLLALAVANGAKFATFDTRIPANAVTGGTTAIERIPVA